MGTVPDKPFFPGGIIPDVITVFPVEPLRVGSVGKLDIPFFS
jgi:hypothetical protein